MIHHYTDDTHDRTGTYRSIPGAGAHPTAAWLARHGWYEVADPPPAPAPGMTWHPADPPFRLVDGISTPAGEWRESLPEPSVYETLRNQHREGFIAFRNGFLSLIREIAVAGYQLPNPLTFRDLISLLQSLGGEWLIKGLMIRGLYDEILYAVHGDPQIAYEILPELLEDAILE